jgi:hypothetical protein
VALIELGGQRLSEHDVADLLATDHPLVERFRFVKQREQPGHSVGFALVIEPRAGVRYRQLRDGRGARIEPVWRTLTGHERIGQGNRHIWQERGRVLAENQTFFPNQEFNDLGIGSALYVSMERLYRQLGISQVTLLAVDVGVYVWARQGFAFMGQQAAGLVPDLERFLFGHGLPIDVDEGAIQESWDLANFDIPGRQVDGYRAGKAFMLRAAPAWHGIKHLDDERHNAVAEASRRETFARLPDKIEGAPAELALR